MKWKKQYIFNRFTVMPDVATEHCRMFWLSSIFCSYKKTAVNIFRYKTFFYLCDFSSGKPKVMDTTKLQL